ncbi:MAG TPA: hypothetical protein DCP90_02620 [Clostridiales bacterium]|nr:MAG: hypothetical protein A2Y22_01630 [Clostridiales bacterium GWD2_32_59]HAN09486.1 hypothetical protein [Clostridiales bacterium]
MNEEEILKEAFNEFMDNIVYKYDYILQKKGNFKEYNVDLEGIEEQITKDMDKGSKDLITRYKGIFVDLMVEQNKEYFKFGLRVILKNLS